MDLTSSLSSECSNTDVDMTFTKMSHFAAGVRLSGASTRFHMPLDI